jgi:hypothetical protein
VRSRIIQGGNFLVGQEFYLWLKHLWTEPNHQTKKMIYYMALQSYCYGMCRDLITFLKCSGCCFDRDSAMKWIFVLMPCGAQPLIHSLSFVLDSVRAMLHCCLESASHPTQRWKVVMKGWYLSSKRGRFTFPVHSTQLLL